MIKFFQVVIALAYILLTIISLLIVLVFSGIYISYPVGIGVIAGWLLFCGCSCFFYPPLMIFFRFHLRRPTLEEEEKLFRCFREVQKKARCTRTFHLRINEQPGINAFAIGVRTIAISRDALTLLQEEEVKAVLAHELGHLVSKDTIVSSAFSMAKLFPGIVFIFWRLVRKKLARSITTAWIIGLTKLGMLLLLLLLCYWLYRKHLIMLLVALFVFNLLFYLLNRLFRVLSLWISRYIEYEQDAYAYRLGYGKPLWELLKKEASSNSSPVNPYLVLMNGTHPTIYQRIRRLEQLLGWKQQS